VSAEDERAAREMLADWASMDPWLRRAPNARAVITEVAAVGSTQLIVRTRYEERAVRFTVRSRPPGGAETEAPDPWSVAIALPVDAAPGQEVTHDLPGEIAMGCRGCRGAGHVVCFRCAGDLHCLLCNGTGQATCPTCHGTGALWGALTVLARMAARDDVRLVDDAATRALPDEVFLDLQDPEHGGRVFHVQRAERLIELQLRDGGYRSNATTGPLAEATSTLLAALELPAAARVREQVLELRKVPAFALTIDGTPVIVYGDPPVVYPADALRRRSRAVPILAAAIIVAGGAVSWLLLLR